MKGSQDLVAYTLLLIYQAKRSGLMWDLASIQHIWSNHDDQSTDPGTARSKIGGFYLNYVQGTVLLENTLLCVEYSWQFGMENFIWSLKKSGPISPTDEIEHQMDNCCMSFPCLTIYTGCWVHQMLCHWFDQKRESELRYWATCIGSLTLQIGSR